NGCGEASGRSAAPMSTMVRIRQSIAENPAPLPLNGQVVGQRGAAVFAVAWTASPASGARRSGDRGLAAHTSDTNRVGCRSARSPAAPAASASTWPSPRADAHNVDTAAVLPDLRHADPYRRTA